MKIDPNQSLPGLAARELQNRSGAAGKPRTDALSAAPADAAASARAADGDGVVDAARVKEIKQAIVEGRFKVNPEVVADRLLATVRDLLRGGQS